MNGGPDSPITADYANVAAHDANKAAKEVAKLALAAHDRIDALNMRVIELEELVQRLKRS